MRLGDEGDKLLVDERADPVPRERAVRWMKKISGIPVTP